MPRYQNKAARAITNIPVKIVTSATRFFEYLSVRCAIKKHSIPLKTNHTPINSPLVDEKKPPHGRWMEIGMRYIIIVFIGAIVYCMSRVAFVMRCRVPPETYHQFQ